MNSNNRVAHAEVYRGTFARVTVSPEFYDWDLGKQVICVTYTPHNNSGWGVAKHVPADTQIDGDFLSQFTRTAAELI